MIASPCINVCTLDAEGRTCLGCFRTLGEIGAWASFTDGERARVMALLPARKRQLEARAAGGVLAGRKALTCSSCGAAFGCGAEDPGHECWCASFPPVAPSAELGTCLCPLCLAAVATTPSAAAP
jgi:predicted Fe-S protein YdhL (DUF1289 family)